MSALEQIEPVEMEAPPFIYCVPLTFRYVRTDHSDEFSNDIFSRADGTELSVERLTFTRGSEVPTPRAALTVLRGRVRDDDVGPDHSAPVSLATGLAFMSYDKPVDDDPDLITLSCELCGFFAPTTLGVIRFATTLHRDTLRTTQAAFYTHLIRQYARLTRFVGSDAETS